ncbi:mitochondrial DNA helicase [Schistocerca americana]|uniref:mitochondrial DNA helicase n=1 Tax=Schistocerca americana TaxID=7009 RepID=UPI001F4F52D3|nr:mitochondrial DNA helicase [Schistocerca americana]
MWRDSGVGNVNITWVMFRSTKYRLLLKKIVPECREMFIRKGRSVRITGSGRPMCCYMNLHFYSPKIRPITNPRVENCGNARHYNAVNVEETRAVTVTDIKKTLRNHNLTFEDGHACISVKCPVCIYLQEPDNNTGRAYINKTTGYFVCYKCKHAGPWDIMEKVIQQHKKKKPFSKSENDILKHIAISNDKVKQYWKNLENTTTALHDVPESQLLTELRLFDINNVPLSVLLQCGARIDLEASKLYFPLHSIEEEIAGIKILTRTGEETIPHSGCGGFLNPQVSKGAKHHTAVIVSSVLDALVLLSQKPAFHVLCLPHGITSLPQLLLPFLERYNKIVLWLGNDVGAWDAARMFAKKMSERRCYFVRPTEKQISAAVASNLGQDLKGIVNTAQPVWHQAITTFSSLREDVLSELQNIDKVQGVKWKRFPTLTKILKGHRRGEFTVLTGPTGSGKTTFVSEYSLDLAMQGVNTLWGSFEIRNARLARTMLQQMATVPLDTHLEQFDYWADVFEKLPIYFMTFHGQQPVRVVMEAVEHAAYVHDIAHVIIDNVQFMMGISEEPRNNDRFWKQDAIIASFRSFATKKNCHVTLVIHPRKERDADDLTTNSIFGSAKAAQEADNVLIIQDKRLTSVRGKKYLQVAKNRYTGDLGMMPLEFDKDSLSYGHHKKKSKDKEQ